MTINEYMIYTEKSQWVAWDHYSTIVPSYRSAKLYLSSLTYSSERQPFRAALNKTVYTCIRNIEHWSICSPSNVCGPFKEQVLLRPCLDFCAIRHLYIYMFLSALWWAFSTIWPQDFKIGNWSIKRTLQGTNGYLQKIVPKLLMNMERYYPIFYTCGFSPYEHIFLFSVHKNINQ